MEGTGIGIVAQDISEIQKRIAEDLAQKFRKDGLPRLMHEFSTIVTQITHDGLGQINETTAAQRIYQPIYSTEPPTLPFSAQEIFLAHKKQQGGASNDPVLTRTWTQLTEEEQKEYEKKAQESKNEYQEKLLAYEATCQKKVLSPHEATECLQDWYVKALGHSLDRVRSEFSSFLIELCSKISKQSQQMELNKSSQSSTRVKRKRNTNDSSSGTPSTSRRGQRASPSNQAAKKPSRRKKQSKVDMTEEVMEEGSVGANPSQMSATPATPEPKSTRKRKSPASANSAGGKEKRPNLGPKPFHMFRAEYDGKYGTAGTDKARDVWNGMNDSQKNVYKERVMSQIASGEHNPKSRSKSKAANKKGLMDATPNNTLPALPSNPTPPAQPAPQAALSSSIAIPSPAIITKGAAPLTNPTYAGAGTTPVSEPNTPQESQSPSEDGNFNYTFDEESEEE